MLLTKTCANCGKTVWSSGGEFPGWITTWLRMASSGGRPVGQAKEDLCPKCAREAVNLLAGKDGPVDELLVADDPLGDESLDESEVVG